MNYRIILPSGGNNMTGINRTNLITRMIERRRDFHRYPESGWAEFRTTAKIADVMDELGYILSFGGDFVEPEKVMGREIDINKEKNRAQEQGADPKWLERMGDFTGLAAELDSGKPGPVVAIRFDIDCVDTEEASTKDHFPAREGFASVNPGWMHACGHDSHAAIGLALAELIASEKEKLSGKIRFLFQPAEEGVRGGYSMTEAGLLDDVDYFMAIHLGLGFPTGTVFGGTDGFLCTTKIDVDFLGVGAHAGGEPEKGKNALLAAASAALNLHAIAPHSKGRTRINVGVLNAGDGRNVIPPKARMKLETRGESNELAAYVYERAAQVIKGASEMYDVKTVITKCGEAPTSTSNLELADIIAEAAREIPEATRVETCQTMHGSDDACWMMNRVQAHGGKATYITIGATISAGHHNSYFDLDESAMPLAVDVLHAAIFRLL